VDTEAITSLTGSELTYNYREMPERCSDDETAGYIQRTRDLFDPIARGFDDDRNTEWFIRSYLALKFVLGQPCWPIPQNMPRAGTCRSPCHTSATTQS
jgi:hypothetical protein